MATDEDLEKLALEEIMKEAKRNADRAKEMGSLGWQKRGISTNKRFLSNMLVSTLRHPIVKRRHTADKRTHDNSDCDSDDSTYHKRPKYDSDSRRRREVSSRRYSDSYKGNGNNLRHRNFHRDRYRPQRSKSEQFLSPSKPPGEFDNEYHSEYMENIQDYQKFMNLYDTKEEEYVNNRMRSKHTISEAENNEINKESKNSSKKKKSKKEKKSSKKDIIQKSQSDIQKSKRHDPLSDKESMKLKQKKNQRSEKGAGRRKKEKSKKKQKNAKIGEEFQSMSEVKECEKEFDSQNAGGEKECEKEFDNQNAGGEVVECDNESLGVNAGDNVAIVKKSDSKSEGEISSSEEESKPKQKRSKHKKSKHKHKKHRRRS